MPFWKPLFKYYRENFGDTVCDRILGPISFMIGHFVFFIVSHIIAMIEFEFYWFNVIMMWYYIGCSLWNGANYYMEYFAKRYEGKLA